MKPENSSRVLAGLKLSREACSQALMCLLILLLSHSNTYSDWPLAIFALVMTASLARLIWLASRPAANG